MPVDTGTPTTGERRGGPSPAPLLSAVEVVPVADVDPVLRAARAGVASLNLRHNAALREAESAESEAPGVDATARAGQEELVAGRKSELDHEASRRRVEMAEEQRQAQAAAEAEVEAARVEAAAIVATARAGLAAALRSLSNERAPIEPPAGVPAVEPAVPSVEAAPGAPYLAYVVPTAGATGQALLPLPAHPQPAPVQLVVAPGWGVPGLAGPAWAPPFPQAAVLPPPPAPRQSFWARMMHLDVILPLFAVAIVLVVLLAWVV